MAEIHTGTTMSPGKLELLEGWVGAQRWYAGKGRQPRLRRLTSWRLDDPSGEVGIETLVVADESDPSGPVVYQVPVTYRGAPLAGAEAALIGTAEHGVLGRRWVYDGPHDPAYALALLELVRGRATAQAGSRSDTAEPTVVGTPLSLAGTVAAVTSSAVLRGEQSNTSIIYQATAPDGSPNPLICKVFRTLQPGDNPDVVVQGALAETGSSRVPGMVGYVSGQWPLPGGGDGADAGGASDGEEQPGHGHLAFAQQFFAGTSDAWRVATAASAALDDFTGPARDLGAATAEVHAVLAEVLPTEAVSAEAVAVIVAGMRSRWVQATEEVPDLLQHEARVHAVFEAALDADWPVLQRIHGDYHLGQVLQVPDRGWVLLDFEGEPLRSLAERGRPDVAIRDVAGMLRSFDYAAASPGAGTVDASRVAWADQAQQAFLAGYAEVSGHDPSDDAALLTAFSVDKALYEVVYEARNRPSWLAIPVGALDRMLDDRRTR